MQSIFVSGLEITEAAAIAEHIISNRLEARNKPKPTCAFWKVEHKATFEALANTYVLELTDVRNLLKVFSPAVVLETVRDLKIQTFRYMTKEEKKECLYYLYRAQVAMVKTLEEIPAAKIEAQEIKQPVRSYGTRSRLAGI